MGVTKNKVRRTKLQLKLDDYKLLAQKLKIIPYKKKYMYFFGPIELPINLNGEIIIFNWYTWFVHNEKWSLKKTLEKLPSLSQNESQQSTVLIYGDFENSEMAKVRLHSICHTGDIFGSEKCDCGIQLKLSLQKIYQAGTGALFYLSNHEGRGIGLFSKSMTYVLQQKGYTTLEANLLLGYKVECRDYEEASYLLKTLRNKPIILLTNNPDKINNLKQSGIAIESCENVIGEVNQFNIKYLETKVNDMNHSFKLVKEDEKCIQGH
ncbi:MULTISPECIES: GTP cyclohydrolase II [unclassified Bacillus (in: firmicutes)]